MSDTELRDLLDRQHAKHGHFAAAARRWWNDCAALVAAAVPPRGPDLNGYRKSRRLYGYKRFPSRRGRR